MAEPDDDWNEGPGSIPSYRMLLSTWTILRRHHGATRVERILGCGPDARSQGQEGSGCMGVEGGREPGGLVSSEPWERGGEVAESCLQLISNIFLLT